jgi:hypothetical protein
MALGDRSLRFPAVISLVVLGSGLSEVHHIRIRDRLADPQDQSFHVLRMVFKFGISDVIVHLTRRFAPLRVGKCACSLYHV